METCNAFECDSETEIRCPNRTSGQLCVPRSIACIGHSNSWSGNYNPGNYNPPGCQNGEENSVELCNTIQCRESEFRCPNRTSTGRLCIMKTKLCDGTNDCEDGADESVATCNEVQCHLTYQFRCPNRTTGKLCISRQSLCKGTSSSQQPIYYNNGGYSAVLAHHSSYDNGYNSHPPLYSIGGYQDLRAGCFDGAENSEEVCNHVQCDANEFRCPNRTSDGRLCIHKAKLCDGRDDCENGADESEATCNGVGCDLTHQFRCPNRTTGKLCISRQNVCTGLNFNYGGCFDGAENSDEVCNNFQCQEDNEFRCPNRTNDGRLCIPRYKLCDGSYDCENGADESEATCNNLQCDSTYQFRCPNRTIGKLCIPRQSVCRRTSSGYNSHRYSSGCFDGAENSDNVCNTF